MIWLYDEFETDFSYNGISLNSAYDADIHRVSNGLYKLSFKLPTTDDELYTLVEKGMVLKASEKGRTNLFRIKYREFNDTDNSLSIIAYQIFISDFSKKLVRNFTVIDRPCTFALSAWHSAFLTPQDRLTYDSSISSNSSFSSFKDEKDTESKDSIEVLNGIVAAYGAEVDLHNFTVNLKARLGRDTEEVLVTSKNISDFVDEFNEDEIYTRIYATATFRPDVDKDEIRARHKQERDSLRASQKAFKDDLSRKKTEERMQAEIDKRYAREISKEVAKLKRSKTTKSYEQISQEVRDKYARQLAKSTIRKAESAALAERRKSEMAALKERQKEEYQSLTEEITISVTVDSPFIDDYPFVNEISISNNDCRTVDELYDWANSYFTEKNIDKPKRSIKVSYEQISEDVSLGDTVILKHERAGVDERIRVVETHYDPMGEYYTSYILGEITSSLGSEISKGIDSGIGNLKGYFDSSFGNYSLDVEQQLRNFDRVFDNKFEEAKQEHTEAQERAEAKAEEFKATIREEIERDKEEVLGRVRETTADFNRRLEESKRELSNSAGRGINAEVREAIESAKREANTLVSEAKSEARAIKDKVDNLKFGGTNLALGTSREWGDTYSNFSGSTNHLIKLYKILNKDLKLGDTLYLKIYIECSDIVGNNGRNPSLLIQSRGNITGWNTGALYQPSIRNVENGVYELEKKFTINENHLRNEFWTMYMRTDHIQSGSIRTKSCKVENGTVSTDWSPAPEDYMYELEKLDTGYREKFTSLEAKARELDTFRTDINRTVSGISQGVSTINQKFDSSGELISLKHYKSQVEQKDREITTKLTALEEYKNQDGARQTNLLSLAERKTNELLSREISRLSENYVAKSTLTETIRGSERKILESIKVGGRNYILKSNTMRGSNWVTETDSETWDWVVSQNRYLGMPVFSWRSGPKATPIAMLQVKRGETYTFSTWVQKESTGSVYLYLYDTGDSDARLNITRDHIFRDVSTSWVRVEKTFTVTQDGLLKLRLAIVASDTGGFSVTPFMLEKGTIATDWSPAHEDSEAFFTDRLATYRREVDNSLTELRGIATDGKSLATRIEADLRGVSTTVSSLSGRLDNLKVGGRNLALRTSKDWSTPYTNFNGGVNNCPNLYHVHTSGLSVGDVIFSRIVLRYTNINSASGQTARIWLQGYGNVTSWGAGAYHSSPAKVILGSGEMIFEHSFRINEHHLRNSYWGWQFRTDYIASGSLEWKLAKVEKGTIPTDWSPAPEDMDDQVFKKSEFRQTDDKIILATGYEISNRKLASMISLTPEGIQAITDKMIITPYNENLLSRAPANKELSSALEFYSGWIEGSPQDNEYLCKYDVTQYAEGQVCVRFHVQYEDTTSDYYNIFLEGQTLNTRYRGTKTFKGLTLQKKVAKYRVGLNSNLCRTTFHKVELYIKKSASLIVDGSITADQIKANAVNAGHLAAGAVTSEKILSGAVEAKHLKVDAALINKLTTDNALINNLMAKQAFINKLNTITIDASQITSGKISSNLIDTKFLKSYAGEIGGFRIKYMPDGNAHYITGIDNEDVGFSNGNIKNYQAAFWVAWGPNWGTAGPNAFYVIKDGTMHCKNNAYFYKNVYLNNKKVVSSDNITTLHKDTDLHGAYVRFNSTNGDMYCRGTNYSDRRYKAEIKISNINALSILNNLTCFSFKEKFPDSNKSILCGVMAQDIEKYIPDAYMEIGELKTYNEFRLVPYLIKAIQELNYEIKILKEKIA